MLNNYYKMFDDSMSKYQVYKVNCVNDSHMIVSGDHNIFLTDLLRPHVKHVACYNMCIMSGLPPFEGDHHVTNIAGLALNIQER